MGLKPAEAVFIGCSPYDLAAAHAARVRCIALRSGGWPESALLGCSHAYRDLSDLVDHWQDSALDSVEPRLPASLSFMWREPTLNRRVLRASNPAH